MDTLLTNRPKPSPATGVSRRRVLAGLGALGGFAVGARVLAPAPVAAAGEIRLGGATMGTSYSVKIAGRSQEGPCPRPGPRRFMPISSRRSTGSMTA